jgi:hypothetical protein
MPGLTEASYTDSMIFLGMFAVEVLLLCAYGFEYVRYKTVRNKKPRKINKILVGWWVLMGLFCGLRISPFLVIVFWPIAALIYWWDGYIVDRMP